MLLELLTSAYRGRNLTVTSSDDCYRECLGLIDHGLVTLVSERFTKNDGFLVHTLTIKSWTLALVREA